MEHSIQEHILKLHSNSCYKIPETV